MILTIRTTHRPASDLGYLLHKNPARPQAFNLAFGKAHVFYPEVGEEACTAALMLDIDPVGLVKSPSTALTDYVNDRPYSSSSFLSVAITRVFRNAMAGTSKERPELAATPIPLTARLAAVPCRGRDTVVEELFGPLGYRVSEETAASEPVGFHRNITLKADKRLSELLTHLYVLVPVLDNRKHYWIGPEEIDKLLKRGGDWLQQHPQRGFIIDRYLKHRRHLAHEATERLGPIGEEAEEGENAEARIDGRPAGDESELANGSDGTSAPTSRDKPAAESTETPEQPKAANGKAGAPGPKPPKLHERRLTFVIETLEKHGARTVADIGCGEGALLARLLGNAAIDRMTGVDASPRTLEKAARRLKLRRLKEAERERVTLLQGGLTYADERLEGHDAVTLVEVIEHVDPERLGTVEKMVFGRLRPRVAIVTTPNIEYNARFEFLRPGGLRHRDHRFEWTRAEFEAWATRTARTHGYEVETGGVGEPDAELGQPTQTGVFTRCD